MHDYDLVREFDTGGTQFISINAFFVGGEGEWSQIKWGACAFICAPAARVIEDVVSTFYFLYDAHVIINSVEWTWPPDR